MKPERGINGNSDGGTANRKFDNANGFEDGAVCVLHRYIKLKIGGKPRCRYQNKSRWLPGALQEKWRLCFVQCRAVVSVFLKAFTFCLKRFFLLEQNFPLFFYAKSNIFIFFLRQILLFSVFSFPIVLNPRTIIESVSRNALSKIIHFSFFFLFIMWYRVLVTFEHLTHFFCVQKCFFSSLQAFSQKGRIKLELFFPLLRAKQFDSIKK